MSEAENGEHEDPTLEHDAKGRYRVIKRGMRPTNEQSYLLFQNSIGILDLDKSYWRPAPLRSYRLRGISKVKSVTECLSSIL